MSKMCFLMFINIPFFKNHHFLSFFIHFLEFFIVIPGFTGGVCMGGYKRRGRTFGKQNGLNVGGRINGGIRNFKVCHVIDTPLSP